MPIIKRHAALFDYPKKRDTAAYNHLVITDTDGDTLKLIYSLLRENIIQLDNADYNQLVKLYHEHYKPNEHHIKSIAHTFSRKIKRMKHAHDERPLPTELQQFLDIIRKIKVVNRPYLHLLGSELLGKGYDDYLTFKLLEQLAKENLPLDIVLSHYDCEFIHLFESHYHMEDTVDIWSESAPSLYHLLEQIREHQISLGDVRSLVQSTYYPRLKLIDYIVDEEQKEIVILTHAPNGLETIKALAKLYDIPFSAKTIDNLTNTIDLINGAAHEKLVSSTFTEDVDIDLLDEANADSPIPLDAPVLRLLWNNVLGDECENRAQGDYRIHFLHGLTQDKLTMSNHINNINLLISESETDIHNSLMESAFSYQVFQSEAPLYQSTYLRFISLSNQLNALIPPTYKQHRYHQKAIELLKSCFVDLLAHTDNAQVCETHIKIIDHTIRLLQSPTEAIKKNYSRLIRDIQKTNLTSASPALARLMGSIMLHMPAQQKEQASVPEAQELGNQMTLFAKPIRQEAAFPLPDDTLADKTEKHVHFSDVDTFSV